MKVLHTADWHLGHQLYGMERMAEQRDFLLQLKGIVAEEKPDVMVVSGDIFHTAVPSNAVAGLYTEALLNVHDAYPQMRIVVTAGNHDSAIRLEIDRNLWELAGVRVVGSFEKLEDKVSIDKNIIEICNEKGSLIGYVLAVPYSHPYNFPTVSENVSREDRQSEFFKYLLSRLAERNVRHLPVVLMAHLTVSGSNTEGHNFTAGGLDSISLEDFGNGYDYLALGHIHMPQTLAGKARYAGSPVQVDFDERYPHSVSIVSVEAGKEPVVEVRVITNSRPLLTVPCEPMPFEQALQHALKNLKREELGYLRLNVSGDLPTDASERVSQAFEGYGIRFCTIKRCAEQLHTERSAYSDLTLDEMNELLPLEVARQYYLDKFAEPMPEELSQIFDVALKSLEEEVQE